MVENNIHSTVQHISNLLFPGASVYEVQLGHIQAREAVVPNSMPSKWIWDHAQVVGPLILVLVQFENYRHTAFFLDTHHI